MSFRVTALWRYGVSLFLVGLVAVPLSAQIPNSPVVFAQSAITTSFVNAPQMGSTGGGNAANSQWLKVEFHYGVTQFAGPKFLDSVEFRVWIEARDPYAPELANSSPDVAAKGIAVALTGSVTYVNVPVSRDQYGVFYVAPSTLARFSTDRGLEDFDRTFDIHVEAYVAGAKVDAFDKRKEQDANWYQSLKVISGYVCRQDQCVFMVSDPDRYPFIKLPPMASQ